MKYVFTRKEDNVIIETANEVGRWDNGYYLLDPRHDEFNNGRVALPDNNFNQYEVNEIPEGVEFEKYCYTEKDGFYKNENYVEPPKPAEEEIADLKQQLIETEAAICELAEMIVGGE